MREQFRIFVQSKTDINTVWYATSNVSSSRKDLINKLNKINKESEFFKAENRRD